MKKLILASLISSLFVMPGNGQMDKTKMSQEDKCSQNTTVTKKYANTVANIRKEPNIESTILDQSRVNTEFEIIAEQDGGSIISGEGGYAYEDLKILAMILCGEGQSYPDHEQRLIGSVFLNRVKSDQFPNTFIGVATDRRYGIQYACWYDGNAFREIQQSNWDNARWLLENGSILPDHVLFQSKRKQGKDVYVKSKWHYYCY